MFDTNKKAACGPLEQQVHEIVAVEKSDSLLEAMAAVAAPVDFAADYRRSYQYLH